VDRLTCEVILAAEHLARVAFADDVAQSVAEVLEFLAGTRLQRRQLLARGGVVRGQDICEAHPHCYI